MDNQFFLFTFVAKRNLKKNMELTERKLKDLFNEWNERAFEGKLPTPKLKITTTKSCFGMYTHSSRTISISVFYDRTEEEFINTIVHEMLHYYIHFFNIKDTSSHGKVWKKMANDLNKRFPVLSISRCGTCAHVVNKNLLELKGGAKKRILYLCVGSDGNHYSSIIPEKNLNRFKRIYSTWSFPKEGHFIEHFDNEVTLRLPTVRTSGRIRRITEQEYNSLLETKIREIPLPFMDLFTRIR